jgi:4-hydroxy-tetrahydrodipicolinate reductase
VIYKIGLLGATGRMGLEIAALLAEDYAVGSAHLELADAVAASGKVVSIEGVDVRKLDDPPREPVHAWIDFSRPEATVRLLDQIDTPILIGTTGLKAEHLERIERYAETHPVILAANTSLGMNLFFSILANLPVLDWVTDVRVTDEHHRLKKDSPSGSALELKRILESKGFTDFEVQSTRAGSVPGTHTVQFYGRGEEFTLIHRVTERKVFAEGALRGIAYLLQQKTPGLHSLTERKTI